MGPTRMLLGKPVIAAINGYAVAGGLELALWCDLRVMEDDAVVGVFCRRWGIPLIDGGTVRLPRLIGLSRALDLILTGRAVGAQEALAMGLANRVVPRERRARRRRRWPTNSPNCRRCACAATGSRPMSRLICRSSRRWRTSFSTACAPCGRRGGGRAALRGRRGPPRLPRWRLAVICDPVAWLSCSAAPGAWPSRRW